MFSAKKKELSKENDALKAYVKELKVAHKENLAAVNETNKIATKAIQTQVASLETKNRKLTEELSVYKENEEKYLDITVRETKLELRENEVDAAHDLFHEEQALVEKKVSDAKEEAEKLVKDAEKTQAARAEKQYANGYADGVADGLRKVHEITADDRRMANQIALIAAASHTPGAADEIAKSVTKSMTKELGSGKTKN